MNAYLIALGSNMRVARIGNPRAVLRSATAAMEARGLSVTASAPIIESAPLGPSLRRYANSAVIAECALSPTRVLAILQSIERDYGRTRSQRMGQRWRARALDLDIVLWSGGAWTSEQLVIPHPETRSRDFVLGPASVIARNWRYPPSNLSLGHLSSRLRHPRRRKTG